jgi:hypothetical protein
MRLRHATPPCDRKAKVLAGYGDEENARNGRADQRKLQHPIDQACRTPRIENVKDQQAYGGNGVSHPKYGDDDVACTRSQGDAHGASLL